MTGKTRNFRRMLIFICLLIVMSSAISGVSGRSTRRVPAASTSMTSQQAAQLDQVDKRLTELEARVSEQEISRHYFSEILVIVTGIYGVIILFVITLGWVYSHSRAMRYINRQIARMRGETSTLISESIKGELAIFNTRYATLRYDVCRALAGINSSPFVKVLWRLRALDSIIEYIGSTAVNEETIRETMTYITTDAKLIASRDSSYNKFIDEVTQIVGKLEAKGLFKLDLELLQQELKRVHALKPT